jgi:hypothetical protein
MFVVGVVPDERRRKTFFVWVSLLFDDDLKENGICWT